MGTLTRSFWTIAAAAALLLGACARTEYAVTVKPTPGSLDSFERKLEWKVGQGSEIKSLPTEEVRRLAGLYGAKFKEDPLATTWTATGPFAGRTPADIGGAGFISGVRTSLGSQRTYIERFRGTNDLVAEHERQKKAAESIAGVLALWARLHLPDGEPRNRTVAFLEGDFRGELLNIGLLLREMIAGETRRVMFGAGGEKAEHLEHILIAEFIGRATLFLVEHGYASPAEAMTLAASFDDTQTAGLAPFGDRPNELILEALLRRALGDSELARLPFIDEWRRDPGRATESLRPTLASPEAQALLAPWTTPNDEGPADPFLTAAAVLIGFPEIFTRFDAVTLRLELPVEPLVSNAKETAGKTLTWDCAAEIEGAKGRGLPPIAVAMWVEPDVTTQKRLFGRVALDGQELSTYCGWFEQRTPRDREAWEAHLAGQRPADPTDRLSQYQFADGSRAGDIEALTPLMRNVTPRAVEDHRNDTAPPIPAKPRPAHP